MRFSTKVAAVAAAAGVAQAVPANTTVCDYYTTALLKNNTAENQYTVLKYLVNTVVIGNALPKPNITGVTWPDTKVAGILAKGNVNGTDVNLLPYFDGGLASSNRGGSNGVAVNFLDDGGAVPLTMNMPANGTSSNQYRLLTHLYQFFGTLLGCSQQGMGSNSSFPAYSGQASQYKVHKFMDLNYAEVSYFIEQVALAATSFGIAKEDISNVGTALNGLFNVRCAANATAIPAAGPVQQSICIASDCPLAMNNTCSAYDTAVMPGVANSTLAMGEGNATSTATASAANGGTPSSTSSGSGSASSTGAAAANLVGGAAAGAFAIAAFFL